jgi:hypothetical protein
MAKRKLSRKARAAAIKNLAKARRARKRKSSTHVKSPRKAHRSTKQRAAARRNIKKAIAGKKRKKACRKAAGRRGAAKRAGRRAPAMPKACKPKRKKGRRRVKSVSTSHRKSAKRVAAGKKAARTRKRHKAERAGKRKGRKHGKRSAKHTTRRSGKRKSAKRVRAGRKAARTRKRHVKVDHRAKSGGIEYGKTYDPYAGVGESKRRKRRRKSRRRNPVAALALANPIRGRRRHRRNPIPFMFSNPISGPREFLAGLLGVGIGYAAADLADRLLATHPLVSTSSGFVDSPPAGMIYDSEAPLTPIWSSPVRFIGGLGMVFVPALLSRFVSGGAAKSFLQLAGYGAAAKLGGKLISDGIASTMPTVGLALQAYGPEIAAQNRLAQVVSSGQPQTATAGFFAGPPRTRQLGAPSKVGCGDPNCGGGCGGGCSQMPISSDPVADAQGAMAGGQPFVSTGLDSGSLNWQSDPGVNPGGGDQDCTPMPITAPVLNNLPGGGGPGGGNLPPPPPPPPPPNCPPGMVWNAGIQQCVTPHAPPPGQSIPGMNNGGGGGSSANCPAGQVWNAAIGRCVSTGTPEGMNNTGTSQTQTNRTVTPPTTPVTQPHIIA